MKPINLLLENDDVVVWEPRDRKYGRTCLCELGDFLKRFVETGRMTEGKTSPTVDHPICGIMENGLELLVRPIAR